MQNHSRRPNGISAARRNVRATYTRALLEQLEERSLLAANPLVGGVTITPTEISGYAFDKAATASTVSVRIDVNGATVQTIPASGANVGAPASIAAGHGFDATGTFNGVVDVYLIDPSTSTATLLKTTNHVSTGKVETLSAGEAVGYVSDADRPDAAVTVEVLVDGTVVATSSANISRPTIHFPTATNTHGFDVTYTVPAGTHTVSIVALESDTSSRTQTVLKTGKVTNKPPKATNVVGSNVQVSGFVSDPDGPTTGLPMQILVDGTLNTTATANLARPLGAKGGGAGNHWFVANLTGLAAGPHQIVVQAQDIGSGAFVTVSTITTPNNLPKGLLEVANQNVISGYAWDPDVAGPVEIFLQMGNSSAVDAGPANVSRPDVPVLQGLPNNAHGFSFVTPTHLFGKTSIKIFAKDTTTGNLTLIGTKSFNNTAPKGVVESATSTRVVGYAFDPDIPTASLTIVILDGVRGPTVGTELAINAVSRPDLVTVHKIVNPLHGFDITLSALSPGKHTLLIYAADPVTGVTGLIGTKVITA